MYWRDVIPSFGGLGRAIGSGADIVNELMNFEMFIYLWWRFMEVYMEHREPADLMVVKDFEFWRRAKEGKRMREEREEDSKGLSA